MASLFSKLYRNLTITHILITACLLNLCWSLLAFHLTYVTNYDGILYLHCASVFNQHGLSAAMAVYPWPFYSILIGTLHTVTGISYLNCAFVIDAILQMLIVYWFIRIIHHLANHTMTEIFAGLVILTFCSFNEIRHYVIRDFGYYAFFLQATYYLFIYNTSLQIKDSLRWSLSLLAATLFRIEGAFFLVTIPFLLLILPRATYQARFKCFIFANILPVFCALGLIVWLILGNTISQLGRINELTQSLTYLSHDLLQHLTQGTASFTKALQADYPIANGHDIFYSAIGGYFIYKVINATHIILLTLAIVGMVKALITNKHQQRTLLYALVVINILITLSFLTLHLYISNRYLLALALLLLVWVPFTLSDLTKRWQAGGYRRYGTQLLPVLFVVTFIYLFIAGTHTATRHKAYLYHAGTWLKHHLSKNQQVLSNNPQINLIAMGLHDYWYKSTIFDKDNFDNKELTRYRYVAIKMKHHNPNISINPKIHPIKIFHNHRGDKVVIYNAQDLTTNDLEFTQ